jgi:hypothetical protein
MTTIQRKGEPVRQAVKWISEQLQEKESRNISELICEASERYNLSPKEEDFLASFYKSEGCHGESLTDN